MDAADVGQPQGTSRLCLSCHDGTIGMGYLTNAPGSGKGSTIQLQSGIVTMPEGGGRYSGDTRLLGTNLSNDHPISFVFDNSVVTSDGELVLPDNPIPSIPNAGGPSWSSFLGVKRYPKNFTGAKEAVQCTSCHNPHTTYNKFLRASVTQLVKPDTGLDADDPAQTPNYPQDFIICLSCHKIKHEQWIDSAHAQDTAVLNYDADTVIRVGAQSKNVWQIACLSCHDTHTAEGADKILRNGVDGIGAGVSPSIENTCFMCHQLTATVIPNYSTEETLTDNGAPNIRTQFTKDTHGTGEGSAMNLALDNSQPKHHEPAFTKTPAENVEFSPDGINTYTHIECVDCHNPHRVVKANRFQGMRGITIDGNIVGDGYSVTPIDDRPVNPDTGYYEPLVYEVCFRCHGGTYSNVFDPLFTGGVEIRFPQQDGRSRSGYDDLTTGTAAEFSFKGYSNKRKEFNPDTNPDWAGGGTCADCNTAFHPVAAPGRNQSQQLNNSLSKTDCLSLTLSGESYGRVNCISDAAKGPGLDTTKTIQCTDCHNTDIFGWNYASNPGAPRGPLTGLNDGTSYKRSTDIASRISSADENDPDKPQGPHGSLNKRLLRGNFDTTITSSGTRYGNRAPMYSWMNQNVDAYYTAAINLYGTHEGQGSVSQDILNRFELCFNCHDPKPFLIGRDLWVLSSSATYSNPIPNEVSGDVVQRTGFWTDSWGWGSLHYFHLKTGYIKCHECHYNVHSNVEAQNTIYGNGAGGQMPPDGNTHLLNFAPNVQACCGNAKPRWYYDAGTGYYKCQLRCHNMTMDSCKYKPSYNFDHGTGSPNYDSWAQANYGTDCASIPIAQRRYCRPRRTEPSHPAYGYNSCGQASQQSKWNN